MLILGLILFFAVHLFTAFARGPRRALIAKLGDGGYKGLYSLVSAAGLILIIIGWRGASTAPVYAPPAWGMGTAAILMTLSFILFTAAYLPAGRIKSAAAHPMVLGTMLFGLAHLLANGDQRSVLLFGALFLFGVLDRAALAMRGDAGPSGTSLIGDVGAVGGGLVGSALVAHLLHRYVSGVALDPASLF